MQLLQTKQRLALAEKGYDILKKKRDALVIELFAVLGKAKDLRVKLNQQVKKSFRALALATAFHGELFLETSALYAHKAPTVEVYSKNIMGVRVSGIKGVMVKRNLIQRGYCIKGSSAKFDEAVNTFEDSLELAIKLAETECALKRILAEIEKTNRRVNALEYVIQPGLRETIKEITARLNRIESEQFFALKQVKRRLQATAAAAVAVA